MQHKGKEDMKERRKKATSVDCMTGQVTIGEDRLKKQSGRLNFSHQLCQSARSVSSAPPAVVAAG